MNRFSCVVLNRRTLLLPTIGSAASIVSLARTASSHAYKEHAERKMRCRDGPQSTLTDYLDSAAIVSSLLILWNARVAASKTAMCRRIQCQIRANASSRRLAEREF